MKTYTKESLIAELRKIKKSGFIPNTRQDNDGGIGNTLEDLLGIKENNLPIPNASEWELKTQRSNTSSLTTLIHSEPSPRAIKFIPSILLPYYGWQHKEAGKKYPEDELSFRQTIHGLSESDRGFKVVIDLKEQKILISFNYKAVDSRHAKWLENIKNHIGLNELNPQPYWGFDDLHHTLGAKLLNFFYVKATEKKEKGQEFYHYNDIYMLKKFSFEKFLVGLTEGFVLVDFDARTGHNHGTKFRLRQNRLSELYEVCETID